MSNVVCTGLGLNPTQADKILLPTVAPPGAMIIGVHQRIVFIRILFYAA